MKSVLLPLALVISVVKSVTLEGQLLPLKLKGEQRSNRVVGEVSQSVIYLNYGEKVSYPDKKGNFVV